MRHYTLLRYTGDADRAPKYWCGAQEWKSNFLSAACTSDLATAELERDQWNDYYASKGYGYWVTIETLAE